MSFLGRMFGRRPEPEPAAATTVVIAPELAATLTAGGADLPTAVDAALRAQLASRAAGAEAAPAAERREPERIPFWLERDSERSGELEDELRDRVIHRHESEDSGQQ